MARLVYTDRAGRRQVHPLDPARGQTVVGRHPDCDVVVADASVSRRHCAIAFEDGRFRIADLGSANGTLVNEVLISRRHLAPDDSIRCGTYVLHFIEDDPTPPPRARAARQGFVGAPVPVTEIARPAEPGPAREVPGVDPVEHERLRVFNARQAEALARVQDALLQAEAGQAAAYEEAATAQERAQQALARVAQMERERADANARETTAALPGLLEDDARSLRAERDALREENQGLRASLATRAATDPDELQAARAHVKALEARISSFRHEVDATRAGHMATDAERMARAARMDNELAAAEASWFQAEQRAEDLESQLTEAASWLRAAGVRLAAASDLRARLDAAEAELVRGHGAQKHLRAALDEARAAASSAQTRRDLLGGVGRITEEGPPARAEVNAEMEALRARARSTEEAVAGLEERAQRAEDALRRAREDREVTEKMDEGTAERLQNMQAKLGAVTRRAHLMQAKDLELERRSAHIAELEVELSAVRDERDLAEQRMLELLVTQQTAKPTAVAASVPVAEDATRQAAARARGAACALLDRWAGLVEVIAGPDGEEGPREAFVAALEALDEATRELDRVTGMPESVAPGSLDVAE